MSFWVDDKIRNVKIIPGLSLPGFWAGATDNAVEGVWVWNSSATPVSCVNCRGQSFKQYTIVIYKSTVVI